MNKFTKVIVILSLISLSSGLLLAHNSPATGYELDIYKSTPILTWVFIILAMLGGASIIIQQVVTKGFETSQTWLSGLFVLVLSRLSFLYIPYIRGYVTWHGDNITHWGYLEDILETGHFFTENYYPITHSFISQSILITDTPIQFAANLSTGILSVFFILATYLLATAVLPKRGQQLLATVIAGVVMIGGGYNVFLMPNGWSILMLPLLFFFYFKKRTSPGYTLLFVLMLAMYPFFHPLSGLVIVMVLLGILIFRQLIRLIWRKSPGHYVLTKSDSSLVPAMLELTILIPWILSFNAFRPNLRLIWSQITSGGPDVLGAMGDTLSKIGVQGLDIVILYLKLYGTTTVLIILSLIGLILAWRQIRKVNSGQDMVRVLYIGVAFSLPGFLYFLYLIGMPGLRAIGATRLLAYTLVFTPVIAAVALYEINRLVRARSVCCILLLIVLAVPAGLSSMNLYSSPYNVKPNAQITLRNVQGMEWFVKNKDPRIICLETLSNPPRLAEGVLGYAEASKRRDLSHSAPFLPDHFMYDTKRYLGEGISEDRYFILNDIDRITYSTVWKAVGRFNNEDFEKLENDPTVDRLYDNGEMDVYYVHATVSSP